MVGAVDKHSVAMRAVATSRDRVAFTQLFDHFAPRVNAYLRRLKLDAEAAEETTQEVMETVWRKAAQFDPEKSSVSTWIYRIARNRRIDLMRRDRETAVPNEDLSSIIDLTPGNDDTLDLAQREARVRAALSALSREQHDMIRMAFFEGLTHGTISERTGLPLGTVKSRLRLAFNRLRRELGNQGVTTVD